MLDLIIILFLFLRSPFCLLWFFKHCLHRSIKRISYWATVRLSTSVSDRVIREFHLPNIFTRMISFRISLVGFLYSDLTGYNTTIKGLLLRSVCLENFQFFVTCDEPQLSCKSLKLVDETWQQADSQFYIEYLPPTTIRGAAIALSWCRYRKLTLTPEPWTSMHSVYFDGRHLQIYLANLKEI